MVQEARFGLIVKLYPFQVVCLQGSCNVAHRLCNTRISQPFQWAVCADVHDIEAERPPGDVQHLPHTSKVLDALQHPYVHGGFPREQKCGLGTRKRVSARKWLGQWLLSANAWLGISVIRRK